MIRVLVVAAKLASYALLTALLYACGLAAISPTHAAPPNQVGLIGMLATILYGLSTPTHLQNA